MIPDVSTALEGAVVLAVALPFVAAGVTPVLYRVLGERTGYAGASVALVCFGLLASVFRYDAAGAVALPWIPSLEIAFRFHVDGWGLLFALLASGIGVLIFAYAPAYMHGETGLARFYAALLAFMGSILGVALAGDLIALFVFWELTSLCSFVLIGHYTTDPSSRYAARMALIVTVGGGLFLLVGLLLLALGAGTALGGPTVDLVAMLENPDAVRDGLREAGLFLPALVLIAVGAAAKSAQVPLHFWLPRAMEAPTPVSAFLHSATMVKAGVYLVGRFRPLFAGPEWTVLFATLGLATMTVGAVLAVASTDIKELLAYSTASHLGLMVAGFGFASAHGSEAGVFHLLNHATFKAALFLVAGIVAHETGTRRLADLGGLRHDFPVTAVVAVVASLGMAGIPPLNGFYSKELLFEAAYEAPHTFGTVGWLYPAVAVLASVFTVLYSLRFAALFFGARPAALGEVHRPPARLVWPPALLAAVVVVVGAVPGAAADAVVVPAIDATVAEPGAVHVGLPTALTPAAAMSAAAIGTGILAYPYYGRLRDGTRAALSALPPLSANWWYDAAVAGIERASRRLETSVETGVLRTYATWTLAATCVLALAGYAATPTTVSPPVGLDAPAEILLVLLVAIVATIAVSVAPSHVAGVLTLSILGLMVAIFYILASGPDLALTQLVVETLTLVIFLLVLEEIPEGQLEVEIPFRDVALSLLVGATAFLTVVFATAARPDGATDLAEFYTRQAVPGAGGTNVVNVILVDFRGFDTLGELVVLALAAVSVITLIAMRTRGATR